MYPPTRIWIVEPDFGLSIRHGKRPAPSTRNRLEVITFNPNALWLPASTHPGTNLLSYFGCQGHALLL
jgi:hypothetical protein